MDANIDRAELNKSSEEEQARLNMLVVEDDPEGMILLKATLSKLNVTLTSFTNAEEALDWLRKAKNGSSTHLIISDLGLPHMDGFGFAKVVRDEGLATRFVLFTSKDAEVKKANSPKQLEAKGVANVLGKDGGIGPIRQEIIVTRQKIQASGKSSH